MILRIEHSPQSAAAEQHVENRADAPQEAQDGPEDLLRGRQVGAAGDVDPCENGRDRMQNDGKHDFENEFHTGSATTKVRA